MLKNFFNKNSKRILLDYSQVLESRAKYLKVVYDSFNINRKFNSYLDIGCGWGHNTLEFGKGIKRVVGVECYHDSLVEAKNHLKRANIEFEFGDATNLKFKDKEFDFITAFSVLEHIKELDKAISEVKKVLKDDGILALQQPNNHFILEMHTYLPFVFLIPSFIRFPLLRKLGFDEEDIYASTVSVKKILKKLENEGFKVKIKKIIYPRTTIPKVGRPFYDILLKLKIFNIIPFGYFLVCQKNRIL